MRYLFLIGVAALSILGGCCNGKCGDNNPVVSPTVITDEKQDSGDPVLPDMKPWWVEG
jgi:hypothetical protein